MYDIGGMMAETTAAVLSDPALGTGPKCKQVAKKSTTHQPLRNGCVKSRPLFASQSPTDVKSSVESPAANGDSVLLATGTSDNENREAGIIAHSGDDGNCNSHSKAQQLELETKSESDKIVLHSERNSDIDSNHSVVSGTSALNGNCTVDTALLADELSAVEFANDNSSSLTVAADATNTLSDVKPTDRTKRPNSAISLSDVDSKKARLENRQESLSSKKMIYDLCMEYSRLNASQEVADLKKRVVDLEDSVERWKTMAFELQKQLDVFRLEESKAAVPPISPTAKTKSPSVAPPKMTTRSSPVTKSTAVSSSTSPVIPLNIIQPTFARQTIMPRTSPSMLPPASARLRMPSSSSAAAAPPPVSVAKSAQSVIDLTDDETPVASLRSDQQQQQHLMPPPPLQVGLRAAIVAPTGIATPMLSQIRPGALILNSVSSPTLMHPVAVTTVRQPPVPVGARFQTPIRAVPMRAVQPTPQGYGLTHPAPLPLENAQSQPKAPPSAKQIPQKPMLKLSRVSQGIVLSWNMPPSDAHESAVQYHLYAYQQGQEPPSRSLWKKVGSVGALPLPMACTLTQFQAGNSYHFAVRAVDRFNRVGLFSEPGTIHLEAGS